MLEVKILEACSNGDYLAAEETLNVMLAGPPPTAANPALMTALYTVLDVMAAAPGVVQSACGVLERQLSFLSPEEVLALPKFEDGLAHPSAAVRKLGFSQILRTSETWAADSTRSAAMLAKVVLAVADEDLGIATLAEQILIAVATKVSDGTGLMLVLGPAILDELNRLCSSSSTLQMRVTSIIATIATTSAAAMQAVVASSALTPLFDVIKSDDVLLKLTAMEQIGTVATLIDGFGALVDAGVVASLASFLKPDGDADPFAAMLLPGVLEFFARLGATAGFDYAVLDCKPQLIGAIGGALGSGDPTLQAAAAGAATALALSGTGIPLLVAPEATAEGESVMHLLGTAALTSGQGGQVKGAALDALAGCFGRPRSDGDAGGPAGGFVSASIEFSTVRQPMFAALAEVVAGNGSGETAPAALMGCAGQPFADVKEPAFRALQALANHAWGSTALLNTPGFLEWMLDRGSGGTDGKFTLAENVAFCIRDQGSDPELEVASSAIKPTLLSFLREGRYFKERKEPQVLVEDNIA